MPAITTISTSFTGVGVSEVLSLNEAEEITIAISGTYAATIQLERASSPAELSWEPVGAGPYSVANATINETFQARGKNERFRLRCTSFTSGTAVTTLADEDKVHSVIRSGEGEAIFSIRQSGRLVHKRPQSDLDVGIVGTNVTAIHYSADGINFTSILTLSGVAITIGDTASLAAGALIYTMPDGDIRIHGVAFSVGLNLTTGTPTTDTPEFGLGSVIGSGANATLGAVGATSEDISGPAVMDDIAGTAEVLSDAIGMTMLSAGVHTVHANVADAWANVDNTDATLDGTITIRWSKLPLS